MSTIDFACPYCERVSRVPATFAGKQGKCPGCQKVIEVPDPALEAPGAAPTVVEPAPEAAGAPTVLEPPPGPATPRPTEPATPEPAREDLVFDVSPKPRPGAGAGEKACPACGEPIKAGAVKCRYCGEAVGGGGGPSRPAFAGPAFAGPALGGSSPSAQAEVMPSVVDYVLCVICGTIGCLIGVVALLQGQYKRGAIMIAVAFAASFAWWILGVVVSLLGA